MACITLLSTWLLHIQIFRSFPFHYSLFLSLSKFFPPSLLVPFFFFFFLPYQLLSHLLSYFGCLFFFLWWFHFDGRVCCKVIFPFISLNPAFLDLVIWSIVSTFLSVPHFMHFSLIQCYRFFSVFLLSSNKNPREKYK